MLRRTGALGDVLLTTPIIQALKARSPLSPIYVETAVPQLFAGNRMVKRADRKLEKMPDALIYHLDGSYELTPNRHILLSYAERCGLTPEDIAPYRTQLFISTVDERKALGAMPGDDWVVIHAGPTTWKCKEWPVERFATVIAGLQGRGFKVALVGSMGKPLACNSDMRGKSTILETAAMIKRAKLFIGLDSFPLHAAEAVGTRAIGLFGVTDPKFILTRPETSIGVCGTTPSFGLRHRSKGVNFVEDGGAAMNSISVAMVTEAIEQQLVIPVP